MLISVILIIIYFEVFKNGNILQDFPNLPLELHVWKKFCFEITNNLHVQWLFSLKWKHDEYTGRQYIVDNKY